MEIIHLEEGNYYHIYNRGNNRMNLFTEPSDYERFLWLYDRYISPVAETLAWVLMPNHIHLLVKIRKNLVYKYSKDRPVKDIADWEKFFEENKWETTDLSASAGPGNIGVVGGKITSAGHDNIGVERKITSAGDLSSSDNIGVVGTSGSFNADRSGDAVGLNGDAVGLNKKPVPYRHFSHLFNAYTRYLHTRTGRTGNLFVRPFKRKLVDNDDYLKRCILYIHNNPVHHGFCTHPLEYPWTSYVTCASDKPTKLKRNAVINIFGSRHHLTELHSEVFNSKEMDKWLEIDD
jgi:REP element-mobilizing transposase RayT